MENDIMHLNMGEKRKKKREIQSAIDLAIEDIELRESSSDIEEIAELEEIKKKLIEMQLFEKNCWI